MSSSEWKDIVLEDAIEFKNGKKSPERQDEGTNPVYGGNGIIGYTEDSNSTSETIIVGRVGAYCGSVYFYEGSCWVTDNAIIGKIKKDYDGRFLFYLLKLLDLNSHRTGSSQPLVNQTILNSIQVRVPIEKSKQAQIANILSALDEKIELNCQANQTVEVVAQAIYKEWFVNFNFPGATGEMQGSELGPIPKGWNITKLGEHVTFVKGRKPKETSEKSTDKFLPQILIDTFDTGNYVYANPDNMIISEENDLLMVMDGASSGRVEFGIHGVVGSTLAIVKKVDFQAHHYLFNFLKSKEKDIKANTTGSSIPHADKHKINDYDFVIPDVSILRNFENISKSMYELVRNNKEEIKALSKIRESLLPKLMNGEIEV
ncbi:MAG: restriction endonuclease subunit S [Candidatus Omnitrophica bacterium]|nr:restriction endonuclease subunit S [Candidatus Omnitrophota bacterium]MBU1852323.1 restriction endonuclease subunit S [Candidatus Omnitrophota bacterium]